MAFEGSTVIEDHRWSRLYQLESGQKVYASKFLTDNLVISLDEVTREWDSWTDQQRLDFAKAYKYKVTVSAEDVKVLSFLMVNGDDPVLVCIAHQLIKHPDRDSVFSFLVSRLRATSSEPKANFISVIQAFGTPNAISVLREFHDLSWAQLESGEGTADIVTINDLLYCCSALAHLGVDSDRYRLE